MRYVHTLAPKPTWKDNLLAAFFVFICLALIGSALFLTSLSSSAEPPAHAGGGKGGDGGGRSSSDCKNHKCDTTPPSVSIAAPVASETVSSPVTVSGASADDDRVVEVTVAVDSAAPLVTDGSTDSWSLGLDSLAVGEHVLVARAVDRAGNVGEAAVTFTVDGFNGEPRESETDSGSTDGTPETEPTTDPTTTDPTTDPTEGTATTSDPQPDPSCDGVTVEPGTDLRALASSSATGTTFCLTSGVHRFTDSVRPRNGQSFIGTSGTVVNGSKVLTDFRRDGSWWVADNQAQRLKDHGVCEGQYHDNSGTYDSCSRGEDVFLDQVSLWQVDSLSELSSGEFWFDYGNSRIYLADDPTGRLVETTVAERAFGSYSHDAHNVAVRGLVVEKFGGQAQFGAIDSFFGSGWVIENNEVRLNHGVGIRGNTGSVVRGNHVHHNGQLGLAGFGSNLLVENNVVAHNHTLGFDTSWEAGGSKWQSTDGLILRNNHFHDNHGHGIWIDIDNIHALIEGNRSDNNDKAGIFYEISYDAVIRNNQVSGNGFVRNSSWGRSSGIMIANSQNVEVYGNVVDRNRHGITLFHQSRGSGAYGPYELRNVDVHHNTVIMETGHTGLMEDVGSNAVFDSWNNQFRQNDYRVSGTDRFHWKGRLRDFVGWIGYGQDLDGTLSNL